MTTIAIFGLALISNAQVPNYVPSDGLVGWWPFNGNANDLSVNNNNGVVYGGAVLAPDRFNNPNSAYSYDGINDYISCNRTVQTAFSAACWCKINVVQEFNPLIDAFDANWEIQIKNISPTYYSWTTPLVYSEYVSTSTLTNNIWQHIVYTFADNIAKLYINGSFVEQFTCTPILAGDGIYNFGSSLSGGDQYLNGSLDDIGIWNRALNEEEITSLYFGSSVGINEVSQSNLFSVFPNPVQNEINVNLDPKLVGSLFAIYDITGKSVKTGKINSENTTIEINDLSGGIYTFSVGENKKQTFKVVKE